MPDIIRMKAVDKSFYTSQGEISVIENLNLTLKKGKILVIVGPSGSGKSTILNMLMGLLEPTKGEIEIEGKLGYMFQKDHLLEWRTIMDNIMLGLEIQKKKDQLSTQKVNRLLKKYGLWEFRNSYPRELSGGMRQRVALIRTLATDPDILLLDEPFSALDYQTRLSVSNDIYQIIKREKKEAILVTHDISEAIAMADEIAILSMRPAHVKKLCEVELEIDGEKTPRKARKSPNFKDYFELIEEELEIYEQ